MSQQNQGNQFSLVIKIDDRNLKTALTKLSETGKSIEKNTSDGVIRRLESVKKNMGFDGINAFQDRMKGSVRDVSASMLRPLRTPESYGDKQERLSKRYQGQSYKDMLGDQMDNFRNKHKGIDRMLESLDQIDKSTVGILAKVTSIAGAVTAIIASSEYLQEMLKLLQTGIMLIFRPVGDFIASILKPIMMYFFAKIIVPMYQSGLLQKIMKIGENIGEGFIEFLKDPKGLLDKMIRDALDKLNPFSTTGTTTEDGTSETPWWQQLVDAIDDLTTAQEAYGDTGTDHGSPRKPSWMDKLAEHWEHFVQWVDHGIRQFIADVGVAWDETVKWFTNVANDIGRYLGDAWDATVEWFEDVYESVSTELTKAWNSFVSWSSKLVSDISTAVTKAWNSFVDWSSDVVQKVSKAVTDAWESFVSWSGNIIRDISKKLSNAWDSFVKWTGGLVKGISDKLNAAWKSFIDWTGSAIKSIASSLNQSWKAFVDWTSNTVKTISSTLNQAWSSFIKWTGGLVKTISQSLNTAWASFIKWSSGLVKQVSESLTKAWGSFVQWTGNLAKSISENLTKGWQYIVNVVGQIANSAKEHLVTAWTTLVGWFNTIAKSAKEHLGPAWTKIVEVAITIGKRLETGANELVKIIQTTLDTSSKSLGTAFGNVITAINNFASKANNASKGINTSRDNRDSERPSSPNTGTTGDPNRPDTPRDDRGDTGTSSGGGSSNSKPSYDGAFFGQTSASPSVVWVWVGTTWLDITRFRGKGMKVDGANKAIYFRNDDGDWVMFYPNNKWGSGDSSSSSGGSTGTPNRPSTPRDDRGNGDSSGSGGSSGGTSDHPEDTGHGDEAPPDKYIEVSKETWKMFPYRKKQTSNRNGTKYWVHAEDYNKWDKDRRGEGGTSSGPSDAVGSSGGSGITPPSRPPDYPVSGVMGSSGSLGSSDDSTKYLKQIADGVNKLTKQDPKIIVNVDSKDTSGSQREQEDARRGRFG